jgi:glycosyltransferase involved in cell wall biosynthesis
MTRVLVVSAEPVGERMAGPAIRSLELARALAESCEVVLAAPAPSDLRGAPVELLEAGLQDFEALRSAASRSDVVVAQSLPAQLLRHLRALGVRYVADLYNPLTMEVLEAVQPGDRRGRSTVRRIGLAVLAQCAAADFVICASEKQRDLWLGALSTTGLIDVDDYRADPTYRAFLDIVPFGLPAEPPAATGPALKGVWPGIGEDDLVLLWAGGIWRWLDPFTSMRALARLRERGLPVHLFFLGTERPSLDPATTPSEAEAARDFAHRQGLAGKCVHFNDGWVGYEERAAYLLDSDLGVSAHLDHLEARFSFRTRVLDHIWAGLPSVVSGGDAVGELVEREGLGRAVAPGDDEAFAAACAELLERRDETAARVRDLAPSMRWERTAAPLAEYCANVRGRRRRRVRRDVLELATWSQYPYIAGDLGPAEAARRAARLLTR